MTKLILILIIGIIMTSIVIATPIVNLNKTTSQITYVTNAIPTIKLQSAISGSSANLSNLTDYVRITGDTMTGGITYSNGIDTPYQIDTLRSFWMAKYLNGIGADNTGIYFDFSNLWTSLFTFGGIDKAHIDIGGNYWGIGKINATQLTLRDTSINEEGYIMFGDLDLNSFSFSKNIIMGIYNSGLGVIEYKNISADTYFDKNGNALNNFARNWFNQQLNTTSGAIFNSLNITGNLTANNFNVTDGNVYGTFRVTGGVTPKYPTKGEGLEMLYDSDNALLNGSGTGLLFAFDRTNNLWKDWAIYGKSIGFFTGTTGTGSAERMRITAGGNVRIYNNLNISGNLSIKGNLNITGNFTSNGLTYNTRIVKDTNFVTNTYCDMNFTGGILTQSNC